MKETSIWTRRIRGSLAGVATVAVGVAVISGCSSIQPSVGQYAIVTSHGTLSNQGVVALAQPGQKVNTGSGTTTWYIYSNVRNYVTATSHGDRVQSAQEITGTGANGAPGMPDFVYSYLPFEVNPLVGTSIPFAGRFLAFCLKYACANTTPQNDTSNADLAHSSSPGWENMLNEIMPPAIDNATREVITQFGPSLWTDQAKWPALAAAISAKLPALLDQYTGSATPFFCGTGSTTSKCMPFTVTVNSVSPANPQIVQAYNQAVTAQYQQQADAARLSAAKGVYGADASWFLGMIDLVNACGQQKVPCTIYAGQAPIHP